MSTAANKPDELDDLPLDLPRSDGGSDDHDDHDDDNSDFDEDAGDDDDESIDLDVSVGFDQEADLEDFLDDAGDDDPRWTDGNETSDQITIDARDLSGGEEDGWTDDNEAAGDAVAHRDDEVDDGNLPELGTDTGEGIDDDDKPGDGNDDDAADLPPIDASDAGDIEETSALEASLLGTLDTIGEREGERFAAAPGVFWNVFSRQHMTRRVLGPVQFRGELLHATDHAWHWSTDRAITIDTPRELVLPGKHLTSLLHDPVDGSLLASTETGLWRVGLDREAQDLGGPSADPMMIANAEVALTNDGASSRLWALSRLGTLFARHENPARWSLMDTPRPGRHLASDGRRALAYIHAAPNRAAALVRSRDGGATWTSQSVNVPDASLVKQLLVCRDVVILVCDSMTTPVLAWLRDDEPLSLVDGLREPLHLIYEDGEVVLYGCVITADHIALIRQPLGGARNAVRRPTVIQSWSANESSAQSMPSAIAGWYDGACTHLALVVGDQLQTLTLEIQRDGGQ